MMPPLEILRLALLVLHFLGLAALIGPRMVRPHLHDRDPLRIMLTGAAVQLLTGNGLIATNRLQGTHVIEAKMVLKLALALAALTLLILAAQRRRSRGPGGTSSPAMQDGASGLGIAAVLVAAVWT